MVDAKQYSIWAAQWVALLGSCSDPALRADILVCVPLLPCAKKVGMELKALVFTATPAEVLLEAGVWVGGVAVGGTNCCPGVGAYGIQEVWQSIQYRTTEAESRLLQALCTGI